MIRSTPPRPHGAGRVRWAAIGAALAVSLGAGGFGLANATSPQGASAYEPRNPCRLADTRPGAQNVGDRSTPLGENESWTLQGRGEHGNCTGLLALPPDTVGLQLNVTAVGPTAATYLQVYPAGAERGTSSNLNPEPGEPPTPNAVTVALGPNGDFIVYNRYGATAVVVDVVGRYTDHHHDDRYYTRADIDDGYYTRQQIDALDEQLQDQLGESIWGLENNLLGEIAAINAPVALASVEAGGTFAAEHGFADLDVAFGTYTLHGDASFEVDRHVASVTLQPGCPADTMATAGIVSHELIVSLSNGAGAPLQCPFQVVVHHIPGTEWAVM